MTTLNKNTKTYSDLIQHGNKITVACDSGSSALVKVKFADDSEQEYQVSSATQSFGPYLNDASVIVSLGNGTVNVTESFDSSDFGKAVMSQTNPLTGVIRNSAGGSQWVQRMPWEVASSLTKQRVFEKFSRLADWTVSNAANTTATQKTDGRGPFSSKSIKMSAAAIGGQNATITQDRTFNLNNQAGFWMLMDTEFQQTASQIGISIYASHAASLGAGSGRFTFSNPVYSGAVSLQPIWVPKASWTVLDGSPTWANDMLSYRVRIDSSGSEERAWSLNGIFMGGERPACVITFDDGWESSYSIAHAQAQKRGIPLTHYLIYNLLGTANYITLAQAQEMRSYGDYLGLHGASRWSDDLSRIDSDVAGLNALGIDTTHAAYPEGAVGTGRAWTATMDKMEAVGVKTARLAGGSSPTLRGIGDLLAMTSYPLNNSITLVQAKAAVDTAIAAGGTIFFYGHKIGAAADSLTWTTADYTALLDYIAQKRLDGVIDVTTVDKWYDGEI